MKLQTIAKNLHDIMVTRNEYYISESTIWPLAEVMLQSEETGTFITDHAQYGDARLLDLFFEIADSWESDPITPERGGLKFIDEETGDQMIETLRKGLSICH